jgi:hypothetical protein
MMDDQAIKLAINALLLLRTSQADTVDSNTNMNQDIVQIGQGTPLLNRNITGSELAILLNSKITSADMAKTLQSALNNLGVSKDHKYTPQQLEAITQSVKNNLINKYGALLNLANPQLLQ